MPRLNSSQYFSLLRMLFGTWLFIHFINIYPYSSELYSNIGVKVLGGEIYLKSALSPLRSPIGIKLLIGMAIVSSIMFTFKYFRLMNSVYLFLVWIFLFHQNLLSYNPGVPYVGWFLMVFMISPTNEHRFFWHKNRTDFEFPKTLFWGIWIVMATTLSTSGIHKWLYSPLWREGMALKYIFHYPASRFDFLSKIYSLLPMFIQKLMTWTVIAMESSLILGLGIPKIRKFTWILSVLVQIGILSTLKFAELSILMTILHLFLVESSWFKFGGMGRLKIKKLRDRPNVI